MLAPRDVFPLTALPPPHLRFRVDEIVQFQSTLHVRKPKKDEYGLHDLHRHNYAKIVRDNGDGTYDLQHVGWFHGEQEHGVSDELLTR